MCVAGQQISANNNQVEGSYLRTPSPRRASVANLLLPHTSSCILLSLYSFRSFAVEVMVVKVLDTIIHIVRSIRIARGSVGPRGVHKL